MSKVAPIAHDQADGEYYAQTLAIGAKERERANEDAKEKEVRPPSVRLSKISVTGRVSLLFTKEMVITAEIRDNLMPKNQTAAESQVPILRLEMMLSDNETMAQNFKDWQVVTVTSTEISIDLNLKDKNVVSQGYNPDMLLAYMNFGDIKDTDGLGLPAFDFARR